MSRTRWPWVVLVACIVGGVVTVLLTIPFPVLSGTHPHVEVARDFTAAQIGREKAFHRAARPPAYTSLVVGLVVAAAFGLTPIGKGLVARLPGRWTIKVLLTVIALLAVGHLATLPFDVQDERVLRRFGLSTQTWGGWTRDLLVALGIQVVTTTLVLVALLALIRRFPRTWWLPGATVAAAFVFLGSFAYPIVIQPAFNSFTPLAAGPLRTDLLALAAKDHVSIATILVADASKQTTAENAYVSGFGSTRHLVLDDTLLHDDSKAQVEVIVAHEMGHAKHDDVLHGTIIGAFAAAAGAIALFLLLSRLGSTGDPTVVPLLLLLAVAVPLLVSPVTNLLSRHVEQRADLSSLELTGDVPDFISAQRKLAVSGLDDLQPNLLLYNLFFDHPSGPQRIAFARAWQARR